MKKHLSAYSAVTYLLVSGFILTLLILSVVEIGKEDLAVRQQDEILATVLPH